MYSSGSITTLGILTLSGEDVCNAYSLHTMYTFVHVCMCVDSIRNFDTCARVQRKLHDMIGLYELQLRDACTMHARLVPRNLRWKGTRREGQTNYRAAFRLQIGQFFVPMRSGNSKTVKWSMGVCVPLCIMPAFRKPIWLIPILHNRIHGYII